MPPSERTLTLPSRQSLKTNHLTLISCSYCRYYDDVRREDRSDPDHAQQPFRRFPADWESYLPGRVSVYSFAALMSGETLEYRLSVLPVR